MKVGSFLRRQQIFFKLRRFHHYRKYKVNPQLTDRKDILESLVEKGYYVLEDYFSKEKVEKIKKEVLPLIQDVSNDKYTGNLNYHCFHDSGLYRLRDIDTVSPESKAFFEDPFIISLAQAYISKDIKSSYEKMVEYRPHPGNKATTDEYHFDDWRKRFKAFLLLDDVTEEQAPFAIIEGSHKNDPWRFDREWEYYAFLKDGSWGFISSHLIKRYKKKYGYKERILTGKAGTLVLADTRAIHRGTPLRSGHRLQLGAYFDKY